MMESMKRMVTGQGLEEKEEKQGIKWEDWMVFASPVGNIITQGFLMAEELNFHFSSVFTRKDTSSLPVPETKCNGPEGERLGQLVVTPEVVATSRLDVRKFSFSQRTINLWNKLSTERVHANSVNMFKNKIDKYLVKAGYT